MLSWIIERVTGQPLSQLISELFWQRLGMEDDAYIAVDSTGAACGGWGMSATLRDLARFGELMRNGGSWAGQQIIPADVVDDIRRGADRAHFKRAELFRMTLPGYSYRNTWWVSHNAHDVFMARGIHGQTLYVDPVAEMVIARFGSHPVATSVANDPITLPAFMAVAKRLMARRAAQI